MSALLVELCTWRPLSARELALLLNRHDHKHLVRNYLSPMVTQGRLAYTIPEMENHPKQRYIAAPHNTDLVQQDEDTH